MRQKVERARKAEATSGSQGMCCDHCAGSKYPCVNMVKVMRSAGREGKEKDDSKLTRTD